VDIGWTVKCNNNGVQRKFYTAYTIPDESMSQIEIVTEAWKGRQYEVFTWAESVLSTPPIVGQSFIPS
jgi:hypothetical protein